MKTRSDNSTTDGLTLEEAMNLQALESNPLDAEQVALERMFDREGWSEERRIAHLHMLALERYGVPAAE